MNAGSVVMAVYASVYAFYGYDILNNGIEDLAEPRRFSFFVAECLGCCRYCH